jgi:hypothetical protein
MKTKILAAALALTMVLGSTCTVFATETTQTLDSKTTSQDLTVKCTVSETYEVSIPAEVTFTVGANDTISSSQTVEAKNVVLTNDTNHKNLIVKVKSANGYALKYDTTTESPSSITYTVTPSSANSASAFSGTEDITILTVPAGTKEKSETLTFETTKTAISNASKAGEHKDTLTFTVSLSN